MSKNETKREQIADAFEKHFKHHGFKKTSVDDIARELGMSKKTIYSFFSTKERIFYYIISRVAEKTSHKMKKDISHHETTTEQIRQLIYNIFEQSRKWLKKGNNAFEFRYKFEITELAFKEAYNKIFEEFIEEGISRGEFKVENPTLTVRFINGIFSESMRLLSENPDLHIEQEVSESVYRLLKAG